jgi:2,3-bisphosphoglycerate-independent phosphoglycerate mutase
VARFLLLFVDGVGLGPATAGNPLVRPGLPALDRRLGGPLTIERAGYVGEGAALAALDAALGVEGLPQSATGQTALFTGVNAPELLGRHVAAFPGPRLAALLAEHSVLRSAAARGLRVTFANPYSRRYFEEVEVGRACAWDVTRERFRAWAPEVEPVTARSAGEHLAAVAAEHDLTLWETFMTDLAGHRRMGWTAEQALGRLDGLLAGLLARRPADLTVLLVSDHGNLEEPAHRSHTRNPVPLAAIGPEARSFGDLDRLDRLAPRLLALLGVPA